MDVAKALAHVRQLHRLAARQHLVERPHVVSAVDHQAARERG
jgi:hypothetical protein